MKRKLVGLATVGTVLAGNVMSAFADTTQAELVGTAMEGVKTDVTSSFATIAPAAIGIFGAFLVWRYGKRFFKTVAS